MFINVDELLIIFFSNPFFSCSRQTHLFWTIEYDCSEFLLDLSRGKNCIKKGNGFFKTNNARGRIKAMFLWRSPINV